MKVSSLTRFFFLGLLLGAPWSQAQTEPTGVSLPLLREQERAARLALEAARSKKFYLVADVGASTLSLHFSGIVLAVYPIHSVEFGRLIGKSGSPADFDSELGELYACQSSVSEVPHEITPGPPPIPFEPDEAQVAKTGTARVVLGCEPSLAVHLTSSSASSLRDHLALAADGAVYRRVRVVLPEAEAERLFASLPAELLLFFSRAPKDAR